MIQHFCEIIGQAPLKQLVVILHGYGANAHSIMSIAEYWKSSMPHTVFVAPNAPDSISSLSGFQWFPLENFGEVILKKGCEQSAPKVVKFLQEAQKRYQVSWKQTTLVGFSQGAMLALYIALNTQHVCAKVIGYSGGVYMDISEIVAHPHELNILLIHGMMDSVVSVQASQNTKIFLEKMGFCPQTYLIPDLDHTIDEQGLKLGQTFLKE